MQDDPLERLKARRAAQSDPLARLKARRGPSAEERERVAAGRPSEESLADPERKQTLADKVGATAQVFSDAATFGLSGLADDALTAGLTKGTFKDIRGARRTAANALPTGVRLAANVAGSLASPVPGVGAVKAAKGAVSAVRAGAGIRPAAGALAKTLSPANRLTPRITSVLPGRAVRLTENAVEAGAQAGLTAGVENFDEASGEGVKKALGAVAPAAGTAMAIGVPLAGLSSVGVRTAQRVRGMKRLDQTALKARENLNDLSGRNYDAALGQPATALKREMQVVLQDPSVRPIVNELRSYDQWKNVRVNDPKFLDAVYKSGLSDWGRDVEKALKDGTMDPTKANVLREKLKHINSVKSRYLSAMDKQVPGYRKAVTEHATGEGEIAAFERGADIAQSVGRANPAKAKKGRLTRESEAAFLRDVPKLTQKEAELALAGVYGRVPEAARISNSLIGAFGIPASMARLPLQMYRTGPIIRALEKRAGKSFADEATGDVVRGSLARFLGVEAGR